MNQKMMPYTRKPETRGQNAPYVEKFGDFIQTIAKAIATGCQVIAIAEPWVIGDTYDEMVESLSHLAGTGLGLHVAMGTKAQNN